MAKIELTPEEHLTLDTYNAIAPEWAKSHSTKDFWKQELGVFNKYLPSGKVIEIGCGGGRDAEVLSESGYDYIGTDISEGLLEEARKRNPNLTFYHQSVYELNFPVNHFDGFWASASLLHIPKYRAIEVLQRIHRIVRPNGIGFISLKQGEGEEILEGRYFVYYSTAAFSNILMASRFHLLESTSKSMSPKTTWLNFFVQVKK